VRQWLVIVAILITFSIVILSLKIPGLRPIQQLLEQPLGFMLSPLNEPGERFSNIWRGLEEATDLRNENEVLRDQVGYLTEEIARLQEAARENEYLREQLRLQQVEPGFQRTQVRVVGRDPNALIRSVIVVPLGSDQIREGMTVVTPSGLVGRVSQSNSSSAKVLFITDTSSSVTAIAQKTRARGVVVGQRNGPLIFRNISQADKLEKGDLVITSGLGGIFPEGIAIGRIREIIKRDIDATQQAVVDSPVDFENLDRAFVITNYVPLKLD
jgi:rod shape-determining protein MreC